MSYNGLYDATISAVKRATGRSSVKRPARRTEVEQDLQAVSDIYILQDSSAKMSENNHLAICNQFIQWFIDSLPETDRVGYASFGSSTTPGFPLTDIDELRREKTLEALFNGLQAKGNTALHEAIFLAVGQAFDKVRPTWLVVMSGGVDDASEFSATLVETLLRQYSNVHLCFVQLGADVPQHKQFAETSRGSFHLINDDEVVSTPSDQIASSSSEQQISESDRLIRRLHVVQLLATAMQSILWNIHWNLPLQLPTHADTADGPVDPGNIVVFYYGWIWLADEASPPSHKSFTLKVDEDQKQVAFVPKNGFTTDNVMSEIGFNLESGARVLVLHAEKGKARAYVLLSQLSSEGHLIATVPVGVDWLRPVMNKDCKVTLKFHHGESTKMLVEATVVEGADYFMVDRSALLDNRALRVSTHNRYNEVGSDAE